jgi:hypothetical protein
MIVGRSVEVGGSGLYGKAPIAKEDSDYGQGRTFNQLSPGPGALAVVADTARARFDLNCLQ